MYLKHKIHNFEVICTAYVDRVNWKEHYLKWYVWRYYLWQKNGVVKNFENLSADGMV